MATKPIAFKLNGKEVLDVRAIASPAVSKVTKILDEAETGAVFLTEHMAEKVGLVPDTFSRKYFAPLKKAGYCVKVGSRSYYGNPDTIKALVHELNG